MTKKIFRKFSSSDETVSLHDIVSNDKEELTEGCYELIEAGGEAPRVFQVLKKEYRKDGTKRAMVQLVDVTLSVNCAKIKAEKEKLTFTSEVVQQELAHPIQAMMF